MRPSHSLLITLTFTLTLDPYLFPANWSVTAESSPCQGAQAAFSKVQVRIFRGVPWDVFQIRAGVFLLK